MSEEELRKMRGCIGLDFPVEAVQQLFQHIDELTKDRDELIKVRETLGQGVAGITEGHAPGLVDHLIRSRLALLDAKDKAKSTIQDVTTKAIEIAAIVNYDAPEEMEKKKWVKQAREVVKLLEETT